MSIKLIYIAPPFGRWADFSVNMKAGHLSWTKEPGVIEEKAYRDIWGKGLSSYLQILSAIVAREKRRYQGMLYIKINRR